MAFNRGEEVVDLTQEADGNEAPMVAPMAARAAPPRRIKFWIDRPPLSKPTVGRGPGRGGPVRYYTNNKAKKEMDAVRGLAQQEKDSQQFQTIPRDTAVSMTVWFFTGRPKEDFVSRRPGYGRLKASALSDSNTIVPVKPDIDNLAKLIMDALTGVFYEDDSQVVELNMVKLRDNVGLCEGRIAIDVGVSTKTAAQMVPQF